MKRIFLGLLLATAAATTAHAETKDEAELQRLTRELHGAVAPGNWAVWERILDDAMVYAAEDGRVLGKADLKAELKPLPAGFSGTIEPTRFVIRFHGDTAVSSHEDLEDETIHGQKLHVKYHSTDTWKRKGGRWRLLATQVTALPADPPAITLPKAALIAFTGKYQLAPEMVQTIRLDGEELVADRAGRPKQSLRAETDTVFFVPGAPRGRKVFVRDAAGKVIHVLERREGHDLRWTRIADVAP